MNKLLHSISFSASLAVLCAAVCWGTVAHAQQNTPDAQSPTQPQQSPAQTQQTPDTQAPPAASQTPGQTQPGQTQADAPDPNGGQTFTGTVAQQGGKYVLQSESGTVYDIDHQDQVKKFEGKRVRVHGTLDASGKMIHIQ